MSESTTARADNCVVLRGTLPAAAQDRVLADGAEVTTFQLVVARPAHARGRRDTLDCAASDPAVRRRLRRCAEGDRIEVGGWLQRRFWRAPSGVVSSYEVEVDTVRAVRRG